MRWGIAKDGSRWFAWRPVRVYDGTWVWLEFVTVYNYFDRPIRIGVSYNPFTHRVFYPTDVTP